MKIMLDEATKIRRAIQILEWAGKAVGSSCQCIACSAINGGIEKYLEYINTGLSDDVKITTQDIARAEKILLLK